MGSSLSSSIFLSTLSLRRATRWARSRRRWSTDFYPRSPCGERLTVADLCKRDIRSISIHALLAESDQPSKPSKHFLTPFLSTLSLRRATKSGTPGPHLHPQFLSTLSLRRATKAGAESFKKMFISIHALLAESDDDLQVPTSVSKDFYPRSPCGERPAWVKLRAFRSYFYPRSPCGERQSDRVLSCDKYEFLSTLSLRRATFVP